MVHDNNATVNQVSLLATTLSYELEDSVVASFTASMPLMVASSTFRLGDF